MQATIDTKFYSALRRKKIIFTVGVKKIVFVFSGNSGKIELENLNSKFIWTIDLQIIRFCHFTNAKTKIFKQFPSIIRGFQYISCFILNSNMSPKEMPFLKNP